jgi:peptidyl-prolyl cis-trans isomerase B (cyclophilin B)
MATTSPVRRAAAIGALAFATAALGACGGSGEDSASSVLPKGCDEVQRPAPKHVNLKAPRREVKRGEKLTASVDTSCGAFQLALDTRDSPKTVSSFAYLARNDTYDDTTFHRIVSSFVIQGGDPLGTGTGGPGYSIDEPPPDGTEYTRGTVAMAKTAAEPPGRSGSQFFVVTAADAGLPPNYAVLGKVSAGRGVVDRIASLGDPASGQSGTPRATVVIRNVKVKEG